MALATPDREPRRLERRPSATAYQVDDLLHLVQSGKIRMPPFQRKLKWEDRDRIDLFDSIYRGFPVGTLLLWQRDAPSGSVRFGEFTVEVDARPDALLIVDGQQRIATLASTLLVYKRPGERALLFDLEREVFVYGRLPEAGSLTLPGMDAGGGTTIAAYELCDSARLVLWVAAHVKSLHPELLQRALECGKRLREYQIPAYVVESVDEEVLREIFDRINRSGKRLDDTDVFTALFALEAQSGERLDLGHVARRLANTGFGALDERTVLTALRAVMQLPLDRDYSKDFERAVVPEALARTEAALRRAILFLRDDAGIPHVTLNPYELLLVTLARFFDAFPEPRLRNRALLRRWLWRASLAGKLTGASVSLRQHVEAVTDDEDASVQKLLSLDQADASAAALALEPFKLNSARGKLTACALAALGPRDLRTGEIVNIGDLFEGDEAKPLPRVVESTSTLGASVANRLLHPHIRPREVARAILAASEEVLESHGIPERARAALVQNDAEALLAARAEHLQNLLGEFFRARAEFGADDSPAIDALRVEDET